MRKQWRCFHCDEVFRSTGEAALHFGTGILDSPGCKLKGHDGGLLGIIRRQADELARLRADDSDLCRVIYAMDAAFAQDLRRAEEAGYAKGLKDGRRPCGECHLAPGEVCDICGRVGVELVDAAAKPG